MTETCDVSWGKNGKKTSQSITSCFGPEGGGATWVPRMPEWLRSLPIFCTGCRVCFLSVYLRVFVAHFWPCSHHGGHFDADVLCHHGPRLPLLHHLHAVIMLPPAEAADAQPGRCSFFPPASLVFIMDSGRGAFLSTHVLMLSNRRGFFLDQLPVFVFARLLWSRLENSGVLQWSFLNVSDRLWPVEGVEIWPWWVPTGAFTLRVKSDPGEPNGGGGERAKPLPCSLALSSLPIPPTL